MASQYENLPVYKKALDLTIYFETIVRNFDRSDKFTIGSDFRNKSRRVVVLVALANTAKNRKQYLEEAIPILEELKILVRVAQEIKAFKNSNSYEFSSKAIIEILKQCEGWLRKSQNP